MASFQIDPLPPGALTQNVFVPIEFPYSLPIVLTPSEKRYVKLTLEMGKAARGEDVALTVTNNWFNVLFDHYPTLRPLFPPVFVPMAKWISEQFTTSVAQLELADNRDDALQAQWTPIGQASYAYGADPVTLLAAKPCFVQAMYNLTTSGGYPALVRLLQALKTYRGDFIEGLQRAGMLPPPASQGGVLESPGGVPAAPSLPIDTTISVVMLDPPQLTLGAQVPSYLVQRAIDASPPALESVPPTGLGDLGTALRALFQGSADEQAVLLAFQGLLLGPMLANPALAPAAQKLQTYLSGGEPTWSPGDIDAVVKGVLTFLIGVVLPILLIPYGRFIGRVVDIMTAGLRAERSVRLYKAWTESVVTPGRVPQFALDFFWRAFEIRPDLRLPFGIPTSNDMQDQADALVTAFAEGFTKSFPRIVYDGTAFRQDLRAMGKANREAGWPTDGYDALQLSFLTSINKTFFGAPGQVMTNADVRLKDAFRQLASTVLQEIVAGAGFNAFKPVGGILGIPPTGELSPPVEPPAKRAPRS